MSTVTDVRELAPLPLTDWSTHWLVERLLYPSALVQPPEVYAELQHRMRNADFYGPACSTALRDRLTNALLTEEQRAMLVGLLLEA